MENERAAGVFLLDQPKEVCGKAQLGLHLFLAVTEIIVGDDGYNHAVFVARGELEGVAVVVKFILFFPAHAVAALAFRGLVIVRQAGGLFRHLHQMRREDDATGVAGPNVQYRAPNHFPAATDRRRFQK